ncbi:LAME_0B02520g1_1 [Lachancea meyersii CBS 8951]|uniref:LAME_0B02520g1_1 n=1 Tax=Lachancea meyersii CBS 8951 TaxID=1266667 RepID=A0A1G4ITX0_9SACH|nr:LAME_0B02520g1_1 [Lachancea meyersii CBS 8951]
MNPSASRVTSEPLSCVFRETRIAVLSEPNYHTHRIIVELKLRLNYIFEKDHYDLDSVKQELDPRNPTLIFPQIMSSISIDRVLYQEDYRKYKLVRKELALFLHSQKLDATDPKLFILLARNVHSNGLNLYLPLMLAEMSDSSDVATSYKVLSHFKHHEQFPTLLQNSNGITQSSFTLRPNDICHWNLVISVTQYLMASARPSGDYSHLTRQQRQKRFNGEKAKIAAKEFLDNPRSSKTIVASRYEVSLSTLNDAIKRLQRQRDLTCDENAGHITDYRQTTDKTARKRVASVALLNVLNSQVSPSKRCKLVSQVSFKYNIPERTLRDRLKDVNPSISRVAEGIRRRKLSPSVEQFLTTFYAISNLQNSQITVKEADAICELMANTTGCSDIKLLDRPPGDSETINLPEMLRNQEVQLGRNFGWRFRQRNGFASSKAKRMDKNRLKASDVNNIAMWLNEDAFKFLSSTSAELIFNADEIGFAHTMNTVNQYSRYVSMNSSNKGQRKGVVYKVKETENHPKTLTTVTACVSAAGAIVPPMVTAASSIAKYKNDCHLFNPRFEALARSKLQPGVDKNVNILFTSNGWNNPAAFLEYVKWFDAHTLHIARQNSPEGSLCQRVLIVDNHFSHYCPAVLDFVTKRRIVLLLLPPNTTHVLQPLDVGVFSNLKKKVRALATEWCPKPSVGPDGKPRYGHFDILCNFMNALNHTLLHDFEQSTISQAFKTAGIFPPERSLFNPAVRNVMKHFDSHARMKDIFLTNILPLNHTTGSRPRTVAGARITSDDSSSNTESSLGSLIPLIRNEAFFIGEEQLESLDYLSVNLEDILHPNPVLEEEEFESSKEIGNSNEAQQRAEPQPTLNHDFLSKFTFEDVLKLITDLIGGGNSDEGMSLIPKLMERLEKCSEIAFANNSHLTITKELFLEQQTNVMGIVMYLIYFGACFLGLREQTKIEEALQVYEAKTDTATATHFSGGAILNTDVLRDLSKKQFFKLFPKVSGNVDRDLSRKIALIQSSAQNSASMSEELVNELGSSVWEFLQKMVKNEKSVLSLQPEDLKRKVLSTALNAPEALAKAATVQSMFDHSGKLPFSKKHLPLVSKIESLGSVPVELLDATLSEAEFESRLSALREVAAGALLELSTIEDEEDDDDSLEGDTMTENDSFDVEERNQRLLQNWFLVYHVDNVVGRITKHRENMRLKSQNLMYRQKIDALTRAISEMANNARHSSNHVFYEDPEPMFDYGVVDNPFF